MKKPLCASLVGALVLAGCQAPATAPHATMALSPEMTFSEAEAPAVFTQAEREARSQLAAQPPGYGLFAVNTEGSEAPVAEVTASSVRNDYFRLSYVTDGNEHSAWSPAHDDAAPTLTFRLAETYRLTQLVTKISPPGVTLDIAVRVEDGEWTTVASGVAPSAYEQMALVTFPASDADEVRLTFNRVGDADALACEVHWYGTPAPAPTPTPTPPPAAECPVSVAGVGAVYGRQAALFAFKAVEVENGADKGFVYVKTQHRLYVGQVTLVQQQGDAVTLSGKLAGSGEAFTLVAQDDRPDSITFQTGANTLIEGDVRCGHVKIDERCEVIDRGETCKVIKWGERPPKHEKDKWDRWDKQDRKARWAGKHKKGKDDRKHGHR